MSSERMSQRVEAEHQFTQSLMLFDYENTNEILQAVNSLFLSGRTVEDILAILNAYRTIAE